MIFEIGRVCYKVAGKDAGKICVIVDEAKDKGFVIIDGDTKRKRCNVTHLEPTSRMLKIKKGEDSSKVKDLLANEGLEVKEKKAKKEKPVKSVKKTKK